MAATETYVARLKQRYDDEIRAALKDELELDSIMQVPKVTKITLNMGVGEAKTDAKAMDAAIGELSTIAGQHAQAQILVPCTRKETATDDSGQETTRHRLYGFRAQPVFDVGGVDHDVPGTHVGCLEA